ncbi:D-alanyl-D-alanine carboxypeptidase family protein [Streptomyces sp. NBC_01275]|uniref:D-alanyl-D-alanine carboxypeptidase family protein n=1 Tax=Streptomyces sp. NBC_01275 TaxID=2903807 RepID=UPI0022594E0C|nr:D-alanyl-D-alanine carboxypeptidase family protein [Streptomyces sp. NBC_01275]MCX4763681.1 D-alanyl-D-alanine carboxypeptidase family protein [Streptomyces sp. NBC_01275]
MHSTESTPVPGHRRRTPSRRRFIGLVTAGAAAVGAAGIGRVALAADADAPLRTFGSQREIDLRRLALSGILNASDPAAVAAWITGRGPAPDAIKPETDTQVDALADAAAAGLGADRDAVLVSWVRTAATQRTIWDRKYEFLRTGSGGAGTFGVITDEVRAKYPAQLGPDPQWDPDKDSHRAVWTALTSDERQIEILRTSTAPGVSRHHLGSDADFFDTTPQDWKDDGPEAANYTWLRTNAARYGFLQTYTAESATTRPAISEERWHWSYAPVSEAVLDFVRANQDVIAGSLDELWSYDPTRFTYIRANWRAYMFHVNEEAYFG